MMPCTVLVAPFLYPVHWTGKSPKPDNDTTLSNRTQCVFDYICNHPGTRDFSIRQKMSASAWVMNRSLNTLLERNLIRVVHTPNKPFTLKHYYEVTSDKPTIH